MLYTFETQTEEGMLKLSEFLVGLEQEVLAGRYRGPVKVEVDLAKARNEEVNDD